MHHMVLTARKGRMVGTRVFDVLAARGIRQDWFAAQIGFSESYVSHIRAGRRPVTRRFMEAAVRVLALPEDMLFFALPSVDTDDSPNEPDDEGEAA